ncbi:MAG: DUF485 domain-containing protein [Bryobacteraceae bacterium]|nr:DUF485 domain-containing protein [Bryobacteraceae bacterium]
MPDRVQRIGASAGFARLLAAKRSFIVPSFVFFVLYYFALPLSVSLFPEVMRQRVGGVTLAYWFALSQFVMAWVLAWLYVRRAAAFDAAAQELLKEGE